MLGSGDVAVVPDQNPSPSPSLPLSPSPSLPLSLSLFFSPCLCHA